MNFEQKKIESIYENGLKEFLVRENEELLTTAYQTSRELLEKGGSEIDIVMLHHKVLNELFAGTCNGNKQRDFHRASAYLREWLAPFEIKIQSYRAVICELNEKNERLQKEIAHRRTAQEELAENNAYFKSLIENAQDIITVLDTSGTIQFDSPSIERILGYKQNELLGQDVFTFVNQEDINRLTQIFSEVKEIPQGVRSAEFRFLHKNGEWVYLESLATYVPNGPKGQIIVVNSRDITHRIANVRELKEHQAKLAEVQHIAKVGSWEWRLTGKPELEWSDEMCHIYGFSPSQFDGSFNTFIEQVHPDDREKVKSAIESAMNDKTPFFFEHKIIRLDGEIRTLFGRGRVITDENGEVVKMIGSGQDVTDQKKKEKKLQKYGERLRKLTERIERAREEERIRIAREIHDELGQMLTVLKMDFFMMRGEITKRVSDDTIKYLNDETTKILDRINTIIESVHRITTELRPQVLDRLGLLEAIKWQAREFEKRTKLEISVSSNLNQTDFLSEDQTITLYRIFQEAVNNIIRHAKATKANIKLMILNGNLVLTVKDDGIGITADQRESSTSFGLIGMRERCRFLGGIVEIEENNGTCITIKIPLMKEAKYKKRQIYD